jgi:GDPmannose 4,6-dehydratase
MLRTAAAIVKGKHSSVYRGNLNAKRAWGHARDFVEGMRRMLEQPTGDDYVLATAEQHSVREFAAKAFACASKSIVWEGSGLDEVGRDAASGQVLIRIDPRYFPPTKCTTSWEPPAKPRRFSAGVRAPNSTPPEGRA